MFEKYLTILDDVKNSKYSALIVRAQQKIWSLLNGQQFSERVPRFLVNRNALGEPYTHSPNDPAHISQVKKIFNALYHAELALKDIESVNLRVGTVSRMQDLSTLYFNTYDHIYQACIIATHSDFDLKDLFSEELAFLSPLLTQFQNFAASHGQAVIDWLPPMDARKIPHQMGVVGGIVIDQLGGRRGDVDYTFLTRFSAVLPDYLHRLSTYIQCFSSKVSEYQPHLNKKTLDELQDNALQLLTALERTHDTHAFLPLEALQYLHIISQTIKLAKSIFEQAGHLNEATQEAIRAKLAELKYRLLPALLGLVDKIESHAMLRPGVLTNPLMEQVSRFYQLLIEYTSKFVDFSTKGKPLVAVNDALFIRARLEHTYLRSAHDARILLCTDEVRIAAQFFFQALSPYKKLRIIDLPIELKATLARAYQPMQAYVSTLDMALHNSIVSGLTHDPKKGALQSIKTCLSVTPDIEKVSHLLSFQPVFDADLTKKQRTRQFNMRLNQDLIESVLSHGDDLKLFPYDPAVNACAINEAQVLIESIGAAHTQLQASPRPLTPSDALCLERYDAMLVRLKALAGTGQWIDLEHLTSTDALTLYEVYQSSCAKLERAEQAYVVFYQLLSECTQPKKPLSLDPAIKTKLALLYSTFQPYVASTGPWASLDQRMIAALGSCGSALGLQSLFLRFLGHHPNIIKTCFNDPQNALLKRRRAFDTLAVNLMRKESALSPLIPAAEEAARAHYLIKHQRYSQAIAEFRTATYQLTTFFNQAVRSQLKPQAPGLLPFPELEGVDRGLAEASQSRGLKQVFNCLFHLEQIMTHMEALHDDALQRDYVTHVIQIGLALHEVKTLLQALTVAPALSFMLSDVEEKLQKGYALLMDLRKHYVLASDDPQAVDLSVKPMPVLSYSLNVLMVLPEHIQAMHHHKPLSLISIKVLHQQSDKISMDIERIFKSSSSYFKLFLEIPTMYQLFILLKKKLTAMASVSHDAVMDHLAEINHDVLAQMLLEADEKEDSFGLLPGTLTRPLKDMLDLFYQGLLKPLGITSQRYITLVSSMLPIDKRVSAVSLRVEQALIEQQRLDSHYELLERLAEHIKVYRTLNGRPLVAFVELKAMLLADLNKALPLFKALQPSLSGVMATSQAAYQVVDALMVDRVLDEECLTHLDPLCATGMFYLKGARASHQLMLGAAQEKLVYLEQVVKPGQLVLQRQRTDEYTELSFERQATALASKQIGLIHCSREYNSELAKHLQAAKANILVIARDKENIDKKIGELLAAQAKDFERKNYNHYFQLHTLMAGIDRLKEYVYQANMAIEGGKALFESHRTLTPKSQLVQLLEDITLNKSLPVRERLNQIKDEIQAPAFKTKILMTERHDSFTFAWLTECLLTFLEWLHLYVPSHKKCYQQLFQSVDTPPPAPPLGISFVGELGLFSAQRATRSVALAHEALDDSPSLEQPALA